MNCFSGRLFYVSFFSLYFPQLSSSVRSLPFACAVPSERLFSRAGDVLTKRRNRMRNELLDMLCTLSINQDYFPEYTSELMADVVQVAMSSPAQPAPTDACELDWLDTELTDE